MTSIEQRITSAITENTLAVHDYFKFDYQFARDFPELHEEGVVSALGKLVISCFSTSRLGVGSFNELTKDTPLHNKSPAELRRYKRLAYSRVTTPQGRPAGNCSLVSLQEKLLNRQLRIR